MAEEVKTDVVEGVPVVPEVKEPVTPDVTEKEVVSEEPERKVQNIPYERFREVNEKMKDYKAKFEEYDRKFRDMESKGKPKEKELAPEDYFKEVGYDEQTAQALGKALSKYLDTKMGPVTQKLKESEVMENVRKNYDTFKSSHKDIAKYEDKMNEIFTSLPPDIRQAIASDPIGLDLLYAKAKDGEQEDLYEKGKEDAQKNVRLKKDGASLKGAASTSGTKKLSMKDFEGMSEEEKRANWGELIETYKNKGE